MPEITAYADFQQSAGFYFETPNPEEEYTDEELLSMAREIVWSGNGPDVWVDTGQLSGDIEVEIENRVPFHENSSNYASDSVTKAATNRMPTRKEIQNSMNKATVKAMFTTRLLLDKKIIIPALITVIGGFALYSQPPQTKFGEIGFRLLMLAIIGYAGVQIGKKIAEFQTGWKIGFIEGFERSTMKVSTF